MIQKYYYIVWEWALGDKRKTVAAAMPFHPLSAITPDKVKDEEGTWDRVVINWQEVPENYYHMWLEGNGMDKNGVRFEDAHLYGPKKN